MESVLKADLSDVRIHIGSDADAIGALAFTHGSNIYFARGQYNPHSAQGQRLIGHELAHVLQQRTGRVMNPFGSGVAVVQDKMLEAEADRLGRLAVMPHRVAQQDGAQGLSGARTPRLAQGCLARPSTAGRSASAGPFWMIARRSRSIGSVVQRAEPQRAFGYTKETGEAAKQFTSFFGQIGEVEKIARKDPNKQDITMYHMTSWRNLQSICTIGLDPKRGGKPGGSVGITENPQLKKHSEETTLGKTAAASSNEVTAPYIHQRVAWADLVLDTPGANFEVLLRFSCKCGRPWTEDPVHHGAWHTMKLIPPKDIDCLLVEGWTPIKTLGADALAGVFKDPAADLPTNPTGLAFTKDAFIAALPQVAHYKWSNPEGLWKELKALKGQDVYLSDGLQCVFAGTTGHPIREPQNWLYVCHVSGASTTDLAPYRDEAERYKTKILNPGWGRQ